MPAIFHKVHFAAVGLGLAAGAVFSGVAAAQEVLPVSPAPFKGQIGLSARDSKPDFSEAGRSPKGCAQYRGRAFG
jgi:hypothetical protein